MVGEGLGATIAHLLHRHVRPVTSMIVIVAIGAAVLPLLGGRFDLRSEAGAGDRTSIDVDTTEVGGTGTTGTADAVATVPDVVTSTVPVGVGSDTTSTAEVTETTERRASLGPLPPIPTTDPSSGPSTEPDGDVARPAQVVSIQTVPAVRDLRVRLGDRVVATNASGLIEIPEADFDADVEVLGPSAVPALQQVEVLGWSDGSDARIRSLTTMPGPVIQLGLQVSDRVVVELDPTTQRTSEVDDVEFESPQTGRITVPLGEPVWLVETLAVRVDGALVVDEVGYRVAADDPLIDTVTGLGNVVYRPRPEALWTLGE